MMGHWTFFIWSATVVSLRGRPTFTLGASLSLGAIEVEWNDIRGGTTGRGMVRQIWHTTRIIIRNCRWYSTQSAAQARAIQKQGSWRHRRADDPWHANTDVLPAGKRSVAAEQQGHSELGGAAVCTGGDVGRGPAGHESGPRARAHRASRIPNTINPDWNRRRIFWHSDSLVALGRDKYSNLHKWFRTRR